jgi:hypothetical protein
VLVADLDGTRVCGYAECCEGFSGTGGTCVAEQIGEICF